MDSKSLNRYKMVDAKFYDLFLLSEWLKRNLLPTIILPLDFQKFLRLLEITAFFGVTSDRRGISEESTKKAKKVIWKG